MTPFARDQDRLPLTSNLRLSLADQCQPIVSELSPLLPIFNAIFRSLSQQKPIPGPLARFP